MRGVTAALPHQGVACGLAVYSAGRDGFDALGKEVVQVVFQVFLLRRGFVAAAMTGAVCGFSHSLVTGLE